MQTSYRFDRFELLVIQRVLMAEGTPVALGSRAFDLLLCLLVNQDRVLSKHEILTQVWPGQVVEENNLSVHVSALRKVLGTDAIKTVSGRGYQFTRALQAPEPRASAGTPPHAPQCPTIALLPLTVLSDEPKIAFFAQGLVEDVTALLSRVPGFILTAHASTLGLRATHSSLQELARDLDVRFVVQGSVRPKADSLRVSLQLIETASGWILWTAHFDTQFGDIGDAQESIARGIIRELEPQLTRAEIAHIRRQRPDNLDAWAHYHEAIGALAAKGWSAEGMDTARAQLKRCTACDPSFGLAHAQYALLTILTANIGMATDTPALRAEVLASAHLALSLDDGSSEVLGYAGCALCDLGHLDRGIDILARALELNPSNAQAHVAMGSAMALQGHLAEGIERLRYGMKISPRDRRLGIWGWLLGCFLLRAERIDEALEAARMSSSVDPRFHLSHVLQAVTFDLLGHTNDAVVALGAARHRRSQLSLAEVTLTHGRRISARLATLWERAA